jgi:hypothetical protein
MRTLPDALALERVISENRGPIAVIGGGFTGCELAASLRHMGREVTLIGRGKNLLGNVLGKDLGEWLTKMHGDHGVDLALGNSVKKWHPREDGVALQLSDGSTMLAGCVLLATGTVPSTTWLRGSGLPLDNGVVCEATTHVVGAEDVVAAGDVAQWPNIRFDNVPRRIEHWLNAIEMGRAAAENLLAGRAAAKPFTPMPRFWTEQYGVRIQAAGVPKLGPDVVALGSPTDGTGTVVGYSKDGRLMGVVGVDCPSSVMSWTESVAEQNPVPGEEAAPAAREPRPAPTMRPAAARQSATSTRQAAVRTGNRLTPPTGIQEPAAASTGTRMPTPTGTGTRMPTPTGTGTRMPTPTGTGTRMPTPTGTGTRMPAAADTGTRMPPADTGTRMPAATGTGTRMPAASTNARKSTSTSRGFAAAAERKKGRHSLPPREERRARSAQVQAEWAEAEAAQPAASAAPAAPSAPIQPGSLVDSDGRVFDATGRIGRIDASGELVSAGPMGPGDSYGRMQPVADGRVVPMHGQGPAVSSPRIPPADFGSGRMGPGGRPGPEDSYNRLPAVPPINDRLRSAGGRGPAESSGRMRPVDPRMAPEDSYGAGPASGFYPTQRPGPADSYGRLPRVDGYGAQRPGERHLGPSDSFDRLPPVNQAYDPPQLDLQAWDGQGPGGRHSGAYGRPGPEDSYDRMPPARPGHLHPVARGPEDSYDRMPPARRPGPEDSYDQSPRGPLGPVDSNGRLRPVQRRRH